MAHFDAAAVDATIDHAIAEGVFPGCALLVVDGGVTIHERACGRLSLVGAEGGATIDTVWDVASLTKALATVPVVMRLVEAGRLALDTPACAFLPELAPDHRAITVRHLLSHSAGLPAWLPMWQRIIDGERLGAPDAREAILRMAAAAPLEAPPGARSVYSDVGFILLGFACERAGGDRIDRIWQRTVYAPLVAAPRDGYLPIGGTIAPTEDDPRRGLVRGRVHDENADAAGGVLGHAGLFARPAELSAIAAALVGSWHGEKGRGLFPAEIVREFFAPSGVPGSTWRLGWDGPAQTGSSAGELWPKSGVGHLGYTGCSIWIDLDRSRWVILLSNRVHPTRANDRIKAFRPILHDTIVRALDGR
jgi:CubicO group peptidase (beta-lactamase class C family)